MAFSSSAKANFITNVRTAYANVLAADLQLQALINESNDNAYGSFVDGDFTGGNAGITGRRSCGWGCASYVANRDSRVVQQSDEVVC